MRRCVVFLGCAVVATVSYACGGGSPATGPSTTSPSVSTPSAASSVDPTWSYNGSAWQASSAPPACSSPLSFAAPVDLSRVTSILYPGQSRPDYKPHGGFRFDGAGQSNDVPVSSPMAGAVYRGSRYLVSGEPQYDFDVINACGVMYRLGHLRDLTSRFAALAASLPAAVEGDSRTTNLPSGQTVAAGEGIATAIGLRATGNVFVDFGVYDLRGRNAASADPAWLAAHPGDLAPYGICWLDNLSGGGSATVRALPPADQVAGRTSDYCR